MASLRFLLRGFSPVMKEERPFDEQVYVRKLKRLARR
jgi:hypothetical protein